MSLTAGQKLHGFTVTRVRQVAELRASLVEMTHDKTGAELVWVDNGESNKLFSIAFKTLPEDSTGVFHILEHSVLCGSDKYPVREPFVELLKSSMNTFLNAMTFPDKTMYPVSSRNEQDFMNLMGVYLDAVFAPAILSNPSIFAQEGWHIELDAEGGEPQYKGVVFNEMKGAMSAVDEVMMQGAMELLYPDTCYGFNSGGDPKVIPELTYEQFIAMYKRYYHPSNSRIFLDGAVPLARALEMIDGYLSRFDRSEERHDIAMQHPAAREHTQYYEVSAEEGTGRKAMLTLGKLIGTWQDGVRIAAVEILADVLTGSNEAPLKRALLSAGLCQDMGMMVESELAQPYVALNVKNIEDEQVPAIRAEIRRVAQALVNGGLDHGEVEASINRFEFRVREPKEPAGLMRCIMSLGTWLYGGDPLDALVYDETFRSLREMLATGGFEQLVKELLLEEDDLVVLHTLPSLTMGEEQRAAEAARLQATMASWTDEDRQRVLEANQTLQAWQQTPDTPEQLATLPVLDLKEISPEPMLPSTEESLQCGVPVLYHPAATSGIVHLNMYLNLSDCTLEELTQLAMLDRMLGQLPTARHDTRELQQTVKTHLGRLNFTVSVRSREGQADLCTPVLHVSCSVMEDKLPLARELMHEILTETDFNQKERIREMILQASEEARQACVAMGHALGITAASCGYTAAAAASEYLSGYTSMQWVHAFAADYDNRADAFAELLASKLHTAVCRSRMVLSVTAAKPVDVTELLMAYPEGEATVAAAAYRAALPERSGIRIPAQIGYAAMACGMQQAGRSFDGSGLVAANIISLGYLWNMVRVQGGAYGCGMRIGREVLACYSYRDPTPDRTLTIYRGAADFLRAFVDSGERLDKFVISTVAETEPLMSPREEGLRGDQLWFAGRTDEMLRRDRAQILATDAQQLLGWCDALETMGRTGAVCVVAHEGALKDCAGENLSIVE